MVMNMTTGKTRTKAKKVLSSPWSLVALMVATTVWYNRQIAMIELGFIPSDRQSARVLKSEELPSFESMLPLIVSIWFFVSTRPGYPNSFASLMNTLENAVMYPSVHGRLFILLFLFLLYVPCITPTHTHTHTLTHSLIQSLTDSFIHSLTLCTYRLRLQIFAQPNTPLCTPKSTTADRIMPLGTSKSCLSGLVIRTTGKAWSGPRIRFTT